MWVSCVKGDSSNVLLPASVASKTIAENGTRGQETVPKHSVG